MVYNNICTLTLTRVNMDRIIGYLTKIWVYYNVVFYIAIGIYTFVKPYSIANTMGYQLMNTTAIAELKAAYGGLLIALGITILIAYLKLPISQCLALIGLLYLGYASGRFTGVLVNQALDHTTLMFLSIEASSLLISGLLFYYWND